MWVHHQFFYKLETAWDFVFSYSQMRAPGLTTMIDGKNKTLYMQVLIFKNLLPLIIIIVLGRSVTNWQYKHLKVWYIFFLFLV